eukprot:5967669-Amphidinium_carterae.1
MLECSGVYWDGTTYKIVTDKLTATSPAASLHCALQALRSQVNLVSSVVAAAVSGQTLVDSASVRTRAHAHSQ